MIFGTFSIGNKCLVQYCWLKSKRERWTFEVYSYRKFEKTVFYHETFAGTNKIKSAEMKNYPLKLRMVRIAGI